MQPLTVAEILKATGGRLICGNENAVINDISSDSRSLSESSLFVPIKGEHFDGHDFISSASFSLTQQDTPPEEGKNYIRVADTVRAFGDIAKYYKAKHPVLTVSVIGSVGKTTTRDMTAAVMSKKFRVLKTEKNYNNELGVPIMITKLDNSYDAAVLELGMSGFGEIDRLCDIVRPDVIIMTNIGMSHIEKLGSQDNIFRAKTEGLKYLNDKNTVIANGDDPYLKNIGKPGNFRTVLYGIENRDCDIIAEDITDFGLDGTEFTVISDEKKQRVRLSVPGVHNIYNALAAFAAGKLCGVSPQSAADALSEAGITSMRMEITESDGIKIINDCYNSAPSSVRAALEVLGKNKDMRRVAVLGDILELGNFSAELHSSLGSAAGGSADVLVTVGDNARLIADNAGPGVEIYSFPDTEEAEKGINSIVKPGDIVLLKASRGMHFEKLFEKITKGRN